MINPKLVERLQARKLTPQPYVAIRRLFHALIDVETSTKFFARELHRLQDDCKRTPPPARLRYTAPPSKSADRELRKIAGESRAALLSPRRVKLANVRQDPIDPNLLGMFKNGVLTLRSHNHFWVQRFDAYHRHERKLRTRIDVAEAAACEAAVELDRSDALPLERTTTKLKEDLQRLGGSVPPPMVVGDYPPNDPTIPALILKQLVPIAGWVDRLRAFLAPAPPPQVTSSASKPVVERASVAKTHLDRQWEPFLPPLHREILTALIESRAVDVETRLTAAVIAEKATGTHDPALVKNALADLGTWGCVCSRRGRKGGSWVRDRGIELMARLVAPEKTQ